MDTSIGLFVKTYRIDEHPFNRGIDGSLKINKVHVILNADDLVSIQNDKQLASKLLYTSASEINEEYFKNTQFEVLYEKGSILPFVVSLEYSAYDVRYKISVSPECKNNLFCTDIITIDQPITGV